MRRKLNPMLVDVEGSRSPKGGWTKKQLAEWGVPWPPPKGWKSELEFTGRFIWPKD